MKILENPLFKSTGDITKADLESVFGPLLRGQLLLKFAEHKNFKAAVEEFLTWDEYSIIQMDNLLMQDYRRQPQSYRNNDEYLANRFLQLLIAEHEYEKQEKIRIRMEDPEQQKRAAQLLKIRLTGKLPHIDLAGTDFIVDWKLKEMRESGRPWNRFGFDDLEIDDYNNNYRCFFNIQTCELYFPPEDLFEMPLNVVVLEIPNELKLDPVAVAPEYPGDLNELLRLHPIQDGEFADIDHLISAQTDHRFRGKVTT